MATLHVHNVPDILHEQLRLLARARQRSLSAQVVTMLERALVLEEQQQEQQLSLLDAIRRQRFTPPVGSPDSSELLRKDRGR